ncbi:MAG: hypothetical protein IJT34_03305 [Butyrivibrio sp.]|nr:hypothetical protein [Butyrivibrio sp.]
MNRSQSLFQGLRIGQTQTDSTQKQRLPVLLFCLLTASALITICSRSSPLYPFNNWDDANSYLTVGKSMWAGRVPYRDLFDQKGILLYMLYALAALVSRTSFLGVWILEILAMTLHLLAVARIFMLYVHPRTSLALTTILGGLTVCSTCFYWGGSAEEFMLPCCSWLLYLSMRYFHKEYPRMIPLPPVLQAGLLSGIILNIKFNSLGIGFAFVLMTSLGVLCARENGYTLPGRILHVFLRWGVFLAGMCLTTLPGLIYFLWNRAVTDWLHVYLYLNLFVYSERLTLPERIERIGALLRDHFSYNPVVFGILAVGLIVPLLFIVFCLIKRDFDPFNTGETSETVIWEYLNTALSCFFTMLGIFIGGVGLLYYSLPLTIWAICGLLVIGRLMDKLFEYGRLGLFLTAVFILSGIGTTLVLTPNLPYASVQEEDLWLTHFRDAIRQSGVDTPTLLNVNCFDAGLYTVCDIVPDCRFFQTQTIHLDEVRQVQSDWIHEGRADFLLSRDTPEERASEGYTLLREETQTLAGVTHTYYLYQKNPPPEEAK